jgi:hypothetical protein
MEDHEWKTKQAKDPYKAENPCKAENQLIANDHPDHARRLEILDKITPKIRERKNVLEDIGLPIDGTERSVTISLELVPGRSLEYIVAEVCK